jgi:hypothetical protein
MMGHQMGDPRRAWTWTRNDIDEFWFSEALIEQADDFEFGGEA